jgi:hypothetical protein
MFRQTMRHQPLEQYLLDKMQGYWAVQVKSIQVRRLDRPRGGCNWEIDAIHPRLSRDAIEEINHKIVLPAKASIDLID